MFGNCGYSGGGTFVFWLEIPGLEIHWGNFYCFAFEPGSTDRILSVHEIMVWLGHGFELCHD